MGSICCSSGSSETRDQNTENEITMLQQKILRQRQLKLQRQAFLYQQQLLTQRTIKQPQTPETEPETEPITVLTETEEKKTPKRRRKKKTIETPESTPSTITSTATSTEWVRPTKTPDDLRLRSKVNLTDSQVGDQESVAKSIAPLVLPVEDKKDRKRTKDKKDKKKKTPKTPQRSLQERVSGDGTSREGNEVIILGAGNRLMLESDQPTVVEYRMPDRLAIPPQDSPHSALFGRHTLKYKDEAQFIEDLREQDAQQLKKTTASGVPTLKLTKTKPHTGPTKLESPPVTERRPIEISTRVSEVVLFPEIPETKIRSKIIDVPTTQPITKLVSSGISSADEQRKKAFEEKKKIAAAQRLLSLQSQLNVKPPDPKIDPGTPIRPTRSVPIVAKSDPTRFDPGTPIRPIRSVPRPPSTAPTVPIKSDPKTDPGTRIQPIRSAPKSDTAFKAVPGTATPAHSQVPDVTSSKLEAMIQSLQRRQEELFTAIHNKRKKTREAAKATPEVVEPKPKPEVKKDVEEVKKIVTTKPTGSAITKEKPPKKSQIGGGAMQSVLVSTPSPMPISGLGSGHISGTQSYYAGPRSQTTSSAFDPLSKTAGSTTSSAPESVLFRPPDDDHFKVTSRQLAEVARASTPRKPTSNIPNLTIRNSAPTTPTSPIPGSNFADAKVETTFTKMGSKPTPVTPTKVNRIATPATVVQSKDAPIIKTNIKVIKLKSPPKNLKPEAQKVVSGAGSGTDSSKESGKSASGISSDMVAVVMHNEGGKTYEKVIVVDIPDSCLESTSDRFKVASEHSPTLPVFRRKPEVIKKKPEPRKAESVQRKPERRKAQSLTNPDKKKAESLQKPATRKAQSLGKPESVRKPETGKKTNIRKPEAGKKSADKKVSSAGSSKTIPKPS